MEVIYLMIQGWCFWLKDEVLTGVCNFCVALQVWLIWVRTVYWKGSLFYHGMLHILLQLMHWVKLLIWWFNKIEELTLLVLQPSEQNTYSDIEAAYRCLVERYGVKAEDVILYGQSVGSGPTLDLATRLPKLRAIVLHSPIMSGLRVMYPVKRSYWFDIYKVGWLVTMELKCWKIWNNCSSNFVSMQCRILTKYRWLVALFW